MPSTQELPTFIDQRLEHILAKDWGKLSQLLDEELRYVHATGSLWPLNQLWAPKAAALIVVTTQTLFTPPNASDPVPNPSHAFDAGAAWAHLALQATASGWAAHAMGGFDHAAVAEVINLPVNHATHVIVAIGKQGSGAELPESMQAREFPSSRRPISESVVRGAFPII